MTENISWEKNDKLFQQELNIGHTWARYVADALNDRQIHCHVKPVDFRKNLDDRQRFENEQDVILDATPGCIEVKSRRLSFDVNPKTYPFGTALVDTVAGWDKKKPKPLAVVLVSQQTKNMLVIPTSTAMEWSTYRAYDRVRDITETWYTIDRKMLRTFESLVKWLQDRQGRIPLAS